MARFGYLKALLLARLLAGVCLYEQRSNTCPNADSCVARHSSNRSTSLANPACIARASFAINDFRDMPEIVGAEEEQEQRKFADGDVVYLNGGSAARY